MEKKALGRGLEALLPTARGTFEVTDREEVQHLGLDAVFPSRYQPRQQFPQAELQELADSMKHNGVLQPVLVRRKGDGLFELIAGERRLRAARMAGLEKIPAVVRNCTDQESIVLALVENLQRDDLNPMETARAYHRMLTEFGLTQEGIAQHVGCDRSSVANMLRLVTLPEKIQEWVETGQLSAGHAKVILGLVSAEAQLRLAQRIIDGTLSVRQAEEVVKQGTHARRGVKRGSHPRLRTDLEDRLQKRFGTRVTVEPGRKGGKIVIHYFSSEELDGLAEKLLGP